MSRLAGNRLDFITLMHTLLEWESSRPTDKSLMNALVGLCSARSIAELPVLASQVHTITVQHMQADNFQPAHQFPRFMQTNDMLNTLKVTLTFCPSANLLLL